MYLARQIDHDRQVAVKVLDAALDDTAKRRFDRERATLGRVSTHPGVVGLFDSGITDDGRAYLVLEWAPGGSLADHLDEVGVLSVDEVTEIGIGLAGALEQAHRSGVMHRDIKPGNIVRSEFGDWLLTDFSVAAFSDPSIATDAIQVSLAHCPPEAFERCHPAAQADVYSLGSVLRTALVGDAPNAPEPDETVAATIRRITNVPLPSAVIAGQTSTLTDLIDAMTALDPQERPATMRAVAAALAAVRSEQALKPLTFRVGSDITIPASDVDLAVGPPTEHATSRAHHPAQKRARRRPLRRALGSVAALVALVAGGAVAVDSVQPSDIVAGVAMTAAVVAEPEATPEGELTPDVDAEAADDDVVTEALQDNDNDNDGDDDNDNDNDDDGNNNDGNDGNDGDGNGNGNGNNGDGDGNGRGGPGGGNGPGGGGPGGGNGPGGGGN